MDSDAQVLVDSLGDALHSVVLSHPNLSKSSA